MLLAIPEVLSAEQVSGARQILQQADWVDGRVTAGHQSSRAKDNMQIPEDHPAARQLGDMILSALGENALFISAALPQRVFPTLFNRYTGGQSFGTHVDNAIRQITGTPHRIRTDLSATLFFAEPSENDGGARISSSFWIQSMIRDDGQRTLLLDLDIAIQRLNREMPGHPSAVPFTGIYHNLLRQWAEV